MSSSQKKLREEFERALVDVLESDYDLDVRLGRDPVNRRRNGVATLQFDYARNGDPGASKVVVTLVGTGTSCPVYVDWRSPESVEDSAADCEELALAIGCFLENARECVAVSEDERPQRRWDD